MKLALVLVLTLIVAALLLTGGVRHDALAQGQAQSHAQSHAQSQSLDRWTYEEPTDKLTGKKSYGATRKNVPLYGGGWADMEAACRDDIVKYVYINIWFSDDKGKQPLEIDVTKVPDLERRAGGDYMGSLRYSESQGESDEELVKFVSTSEIQVQLPLPIQDADLAGLAALFAGNQVSARSFANAPFAKIEIPIYAQGEQPILDLKPQDPALRRVLGQCLPESLSALDAKAKQDREADMAIQQRNADEAQAEAADAASKPADAASKARDRHLIEVKNACASGQQMKIIGYGNIMLAGIRGGSSLDGYIGTGQVVVGVPDANAPSYSCRVQYSVRNRIVSGYVPVDRLGLATGN